MSAPRVTVAVTQRESFGHTKRSLDSLYATADAPFELLYVDAGSPPSIQRLIDGESRRRGFKVLRFPSIIAPNATHNLVLAAVESEFIAFVDNDVIFKPGWLRELLACADETGADFVAALTFMVHPPFTYVHFAGGDIRIEQTAARRTYRETFPFGMQRIDRIANPFVRARTGKVEFHCALARRSIFARIGPFDEAITSLCEHADTSMRVQQAGGLMMLEPAAQVSYLSPKPFPLDIQSMPFYFARWSRRSNRSSMDHFRAKWQIPPDDYLTEEAYYWATDRRWLMFRFLRLRFFLRALRKVRRIVRSFGG
jgi:GT2 family glycosyltransferase